MQSHNVNQYLNHVFILECYLDERVTKKKDIKMKEYTYKKLCRNFTFSKLGKINFCNVKAARSQKSAMHESNHILLFKTFLRILCFVSIQEENL